MRLGGLLAATVILAGLAGGLYYSNKQKAAEAGKPSPDAPPKILALTDGDISKISVQKKGESPTILEKNGVGKWVMASPQLPVDQDAATQLISASANVSADKLVEAKDSDPKNYGFDQPSLLVDITSKGKVSKLRLGDDAPANLGTYAMLEGDPRVFTVASYVKSGLDKTANDLRDKRLLNFDQDKLSRVEFISPKQTIEFGRDKDQWQIIKPKPLRADSSIVFDMIRAAENAKMDLATSEDDTKKAASSFASGTAVATLKFTDPTGTQQLEVRKNKDDYFGKSSLVSGVYKLPADVGTAASKSLDDFRNKKLFDFGFSDPSKIEIHSNGKFYGFQKGGEDWFSNGKKMDNIAVQAFLDKLRDLGASKFIDSGSLGAPAIDMAVTSTDGKKTEKVLLAKQGGDYTAQREGEPSLYGVDASTVDALLKAADDVKPAVPPAKK